MLLVLDTCFNACSAALYDEAAGHVVASEYEAMERGHAEALGPMVERLFAEAGLKPDQLSRIAVTYGPGTFTGLRIGLSFAKGMALALKIPLIGINSLTATAAPHFGMHLNFAVVLRAGRTGLFYWTLLDGITSTPIIPPSLSSMPDIVKALMGDAPYVLVDDSDELELLWADGRELLPASGPHAEFFAAYASSLSVTGKSVDPLYLRPPDAKPSVSVDAATARTRLATEHDLVVLADIHAASFATGWTVADLSSNLAIPGAAAVVVELAGTIYGFVQFQWVAGEAEITTICVLPNYRRQHFGRDLMEGLIRQLQAMKTTKLFLEVAENNAAARGLYESFGFQPSGLRKGYYADGQNAVTMVKEMSA
jgi:tRNA threonylcarbamoyl adenosine modification protein YeaZ/ribosomal-protein-alanine acetyltransferase